MTQNAMHKFWQLGLCRKLTHAGATKLKLMMLFQKEKKNLDWKTTWLEPKNKGRGRGRLLLLVGCRGIFVQHLKTCVMKLSPTCCGGYIYILLNFTS